MSDQRELFQAETTWFHIFKAMIDSGDLAKLSGSSIKVYLVVKSYTNFSTGNSFPSIETIAGKSGVSVPQVKRELKSLEEAGYISRTKNGRNNVYTLREKVEITDEQGRPSAVASWDYIPSTVKHAMADLKNVLVSGELGDARIVHIEKLHVEFIQGDKIGVQLNGDEMVKLMANHPELLEKLQEAQAKQAKANKG